MVVGWDSVAVTYTSDIALVSSKKFHDIQTTAECRFTLKYACYMIRTHIQSLCGYFIDAKQMSNTLFTNFSTELRKQTGIHSSLIFKENHVFIEELLQLTKN